MVRVSTYLNFTGNTEEAFHFYRSVFGTETDFAHRRHARRSVHARAFRRGEEPDDAH